MYHYLHYYVFMYYPILLREKLKIIDNVQQRLDEKLKFTRGLLGSDMSAALAALSEFKARTGREWTDEKVRDVHSFHYYPSPLES